jgi:hypothetical protein
MNPPLCSVLIPTRNRVASLESAIGSWLLTADNPANVEIIVRVHDDDPATLAWAASRDRVRHGAPIRVLIGDTGDSYGSMGEFNGALAAVSRGLWLCPQADDFRCLTRGWDTMLAARCPDPARTLLMLSSAFPEGRLQILSSGFYHAVGHLGLTEHTDTYMFTLADLAGIHQTIDIRMEGVLLPEVGPRDRPKTWEQFRSAETAHRFNTDKLKLAAVLGRPITGAWTTSDAPTGIT